MWTQACACADLEDVKKLQRGCVQENAAQQNAWRGYHKAFFHLKTITKNEGCRESLGVTLLLQLPLLQLAPCFMVVAARTHRDRP